MDKHNLVNKLVAKLNNLVDFEEKVCEQHYIVDIAMVTDDSASIKMVTNLANNKEGNFEEAKPGYAL